MGTAVRRSRRQARDHRAHWDRPQRGSLTYVALGDSAGVGVGVEDPRLGYVGLLAERLATSTGESVRTVNLSVSGARARDVLETQIPRLAALDVPDVLTCVIGGNDVAWATHFSPQAFARTMTGIASALPAGSVMGLVPHFVHPPYSTRAQEANRAITAAARANGHLAADLHTATRSLPLKEYLRTFSGDRFHPGARGYALWADVLWESIASTDAIAAWAALRQRSRAHHGGAHRP